MLYGYPHKPHTLSNFYLFLNTLTDTMPALGRLLSGDIHAPINLRSKMTDTMTDLSRLLSGDRQVPIDLHTDMLWYRCTKLRGSVFGLSCSNCHIFYFELQWP